MPRDWDKVLSELHERIPALEKANWSALARHDPKILGAIVGDVIKVSVSPRGRAGKRSIATAREANANYARLRHLDYAEEPFTEVMKAFLQFRSLRAIAREAYLDKNTLHRLVHGKRSPSTEQLEVIARAIGKEPSFFIEYRAAVVAVAIYNMLLDIHESSTVLYHKLNRDYGCS
jgi:hypothetical protein